MTNVHKTSIEREKQNTISSMSTNTITNTETNNRELNGVRMSNTNVTPNTNTNVTSSWYIKWTKTIEIMEENTDESSNGATMDDTKHWAK